MTARQREGEDVAPEAATVLSFVSLDRKREEVEEARGGGIAYIHAALLHVRPRGNQRQREMRCTPDELRQCVLKE